MKCNFPNCDGGYATGYCHKDCRDELEAQTMRKCFDEIQRSTDAIGKKEFEKLPNEKIS